MLIAGEVKIIWRRVPGCAAEPRGHNRCHKSCGCSPVSAWVPQTPRHRPLWGCCCDTWGSTEHLHPLTVPGNLCIGPGYIPYHLEVPYIISAPAPERVQQGCTCPCHSLALTEQTPLVPQSQGGTNHRHPGERGFGGADGDGLPQPPCGTRGDTGKKGLSGHSAAEHPAGQRCPSGHWTAGHLLRTLGRSVPVDIGQQDIPRGHWGPWGQSLLWAGVGDAAGRAEDSSFWTAVSEAAVAGTAVAEAAEWQG